MRIIADVVRGREAPRKLKMESSSLQSACESLSRQGYSVLSARRDGWLWGEGIGPRQAMARADVLVFVEQLRDLLGAGLSVIEAIETVRRGSPTARRMALERLEERLRGGERLSVALAAEDSWPELLVALVRASELTSALTPALTRYMEHEQRAAEVRHRLSSVALYPMLLTLVGLVVLLFLLFYVMPRFARVFEGMNGALPWSAEAMVWWSQWLAAHKLGLTLGAALLAAMLVSPAFSPTLRARTLRWLLDSTLVRARLRTYFLARWYRTTGMLVEGGIPLPEALPLSNGLLPLALRESGAAVERSLRNGLGPLQAFGQAGMATPVAEQLLRAGESAGQLGAVLMRIAQFHDAEIARALERGMRALEPMVMVLIGVGVGVVVVLMYMPIFELASAIQ